MNRLRLIFMGSPDFSVAALDALVKVGHEIVCVYAQPPRPSGRGHKLKNGPVHARAEELGISVRTPVSLKDVAEQQAFAALEADACVVVAYGLILPKAVINAPRMGCLNIHASLLPRWRGAAPIQRAILAGDAKSGVCIMQMDEGLDTGGVLLRGETQLTASTTASSLHDALSEMGAGLIVEALEGVSNGTLSAVPQPEQGMTYAAKLTNAEGQLDWNQTADQLERAVRALTPWPGVWFEHEGQRLKVKSALKVDGPLNTKTGAIKTGETEPGLVVDDQLTIACKEGGFRPLTLQRPGKGVMNADVFLRGYEIPQGTKLS